jgi:hypothetical protein
MDPRPIRIPVFEPIEMAYPEDAVHHATSSFVEVFPHGINTVKVAIDGTVRVVDGVSLANAVNSLLGRVRQRRK